MVACNSDGPRQRGACRAAAEGCTPRYFTSTFPKYDRCPTLCGSAAKKGRFWLPACCRRGGDIPKALETCQVPARKPCISQDARRFARDVCCRGHAQGLAALAICCVVRSTRCLPVRTTGKRDTEVVPDRIGDRFLPEQGAWPGAMYATGSLVKCGRGLVCSGLATSSRGSTRGAGTSAAAKAGIGSLR